LTRAVAAAALVVAAGGIPGTTSVKVCAAAGPYWPTMTLALHGTSAWIACKEQSRVVRVTASTGRTTKSIPLRGPAIAVKTGLGSIWALDSLGTLYRLSPSTGNVVRRISLPVSAAYNIWIGGGSVWVADDQGSQVVRVSTRTNRVVSRLATGDGPASMAFSGATGWVMNHRDRVLTRIDLRTNRATALATIPGANAAPERMVWAHGSLWITGRGADLLKVNPATGAVEQTIEIGASGIDLAASGDTLWVPTRSAETDVRGFPTMDAVKRVSMSTGDVATIAKPSGRVDVHGLAAQNGVLWLADNTNGRLYRISH
jgi:hypothetical protein